MGQFREGGGECLPVTGPDCEEPLRYVKEFVLRENGSILKPWRRLIKKIILIALWRILWRGLKLSGRGNN